MAQNPQTAALNAMLPGKDGVIPRTVPPSDLELGLDALGNVLDIMQDPQKSPADVKAAVAAYGNQPPHEHLESEARLAQALGYGNHSSNGSKPSQ